MKKAISLLVAMACVLSLSVVAFAADDIPGVNTRQYSTLADSDPGVGISPAISGDINVTDWKATVGKNELYLVDSNGQVVGGIYNRLEPDTEYTFDIYYNGGDAAADLDITSANEFKKEDRMTGAELAGGTIRLRTLKGSNSISSARIKTTGRNDNATYQLVINTRANYNTKLVDVEYSLGVTGSTNTFVTSSHFFEVGYNQIGDDETEVGEGGYITISNDYPVITKDQFTSIAKSSNYKVVNFEAEDGGWMFTGRVSGMGDTNFHYSYDVIPEVITKLPDQEFKFLTFNAGVTFPSSGEMRIDVSDIYDYYDGNMYAYMYRNGKLTPIDHTYDSGTNEIVFRTNYLGSFVITDERITDLSMIGEPEPQEPEPEEPDDGDDNNNGTGNGSGNPNTGAASAMNLAVALGLASLVSAKAVSRKRK